MATKPTIYSQIRYSNKIPRIGRGLSSDEPFLVFEIPQEILICWHSLKAKTTGASYTNFIEETQALPFGLVNAPSLEKRIQDAALIAVRECHGKSGNKKIKLLQKIRRVKVCRSDIAKPKPCGEVREEEVCELEQRCSELYSELLEEKVNARKCENGVKNCEAKIILLQEQNTTLTEYVNNIEELNVCQSCTDSVSNKSNTLGNVGPRQRQRKLKELKTKAERALWFLESYGTTTKSLVVVDPNGDEIELDISPGDKNAKSKYEDLEEEDKVKIKEVLHILDTFCIGDAAYHKLSVVESGLPRSYLIKQCRSEVNGVFTITRTQGDLLGAQMSFREELRRKLKKQVEKGQKGCQKVKISGDGAKISRISNYIVMSFSLLSDEQDVMSTKGNHAFAVLCGKECYETMEVSFQELFNEINEIINEGEMDVDGEKIQLQFFLGGDYKFLLAMLGMNAANSNYACIYCKIHKENRWDMTKPELYYWADKDMKRTLENNKDLSKKKKDNFGCISQPLLDIALENVRIDELHLLLRISDVLEKNVIMNTIRWDLCDDKNKKASEPKGLHLTALVKAINECGISFTVWTKVDGKGKKTSGHDWRSLVGKEKKQLLKYLPERFREVLQPGTCNTVKQIWQGFELLYNTITAWSPSKESQDNFFEQACDWVNLFLTLKDKEDGYSKENITPYIHLLVYHVPKYVQDDGMKIFTGQGVEKINDVVRNIYHKKCNKLDACKDSLLALKRLDYLSDHKRKPNSYAKHNDKYWTTTIFDKRRRIDTSGSV